MVGLLMLSFFIAVYISSSLVLGSAKRGSQLTKERIMEIGESSSNHGIDSMRQAERDKRRLNLDLIHVSRKLEEDLDISGLNIRGEEFIFIWILVAVVPAFLYFSISGSIFKTILVIFVLAILPPIYVRILISRKRLKFEEQLGDSLQVLSNGIRSGFSFQQAMNNLSRDMPDPLGSEFRKAAREINLGVDIETAFTKISHRMDSEDMEILTAAIVVQRQVGGNLSYILDSITETIRERLNMRSLIRTLTAQGRISGLIIGGIPIGLLIIITMMNPEYMEVLYTTTYGYIVLTIAVVLEVIGFLFIREIIDIEY